MKLSSILSKNLIKIGLSANTKKEVFRELVSFAKENYYKELNVENVFNAVLERENQQSTYMGKGLMIPHARLDDLNEFIIICGLSKDGVLIEEKGEKAHFFVMILLCKTKINMLLQTMGAFAAFFSNDKFVEKLKSVDNADEFIKVIDSSGVLIKETMTAGDIMQKQVIYVTSNHTLKDVLDIFFTHNISGAPVLDEEGRVIGVVTEKELIGMGIPKYMSMMDDISFLSDFEPFEEFFKKEDAIKVKDIMSENFVFVHENVTIIQLAFHFIHKSCRRIMVVDDDKKLLGIVMRKDLIRKVIHA